MSSRDSGQTIIWMAVTAAVGLLLGPVVIQSCRSKKPTARPVVAVAASPAPTAESVLSPASPNSPASAPLFAPAPPLAVPAPAPIAADSRVSDGSDRNERGQVFTTLEKASPDPLFANPVKQRLQSGNTSHPPPHLLPGAAPIERNRR